MITKIGSSLQVTRKCQLSQLTTYQTALHLLLLDSYPTLIFRKKNMVTSCFPSFLTLLPQYHKK